MSVATRTMGTNARKKANGCLRSVCATAVSCASGCGLRLRILYRFIVDNPTINKRTAKVEVTIVRPSPAFGLLPSTPWTRGIPSAHTEDRVMNVKNWALV